MPVFRVERNRNYTTMSNYHLRDKDLSLKAKGLLSMCLSLTESWDYSVNGLVAISKEGRDAILSAVRELEQAGYIVRSRERDERGCLRGAAYAIYEVPQSPVADSPKLDFPTLEKPTQAIPTLDSPAQENPAQLRTDQSNTETINDGDNAKGIQLRSYEHDREIRLTWGEVDKRLDLLIQRGQYLSAVEQEKYQDLELEFGAALPMPTPAHIYPVRTPEPANTGNQYLDEMFNQASELYARSELAAPERFIVMETDDGYAVWDEIQEGIHVEPDGASEEFTSEWEAETYRQELIQKVQEREAKDWLYVEQAKQDISDSEISETPIEKEMREHSEELAKAQGYAPDEAYVVTMTSDAFPDPADAFAIWDNIHDEYYAYSDGKVLTFATLEEAEKGLEEVRNAEHQPIPTAEMENDGSAVSEESLSAEPEPAPPVQPDYRVGDKTKTETQEWLVAQKIVQTILGEEQKKQEEHEQEVRQDAVSHENDR